MLKKLQSLKAKKGFTLVELIVVIAIIAVLAAILVPTMMGYVTSSRVTSADSTAASLKDTVGNAMVETDAKGFPVPGSATVTLGGTSAAPTVSIGTLNADGGTGASTTPDYSKLEKAIENKIKGDYNFTKSFTAVVHIKDRKVVACAYCADASAVTTVGGFSCGELLSGTTSKWKENTDGITSDSNNYIIGTSPKLTYDSGSTPPSGGTTEA